jgi:3-deoxy-D-arabino-heptulosonate 7-phosphate (DAHP) synthase class II
MKNVLKVALIGMGAYLLYDHLTKKEKNEEKVDAIKGIVAGSDIAAVSEEISEEEVTEGEAMAQQMGDTAYDTKEVEADVVKEQMASADGWDSDNLSVGL